ncbi:MAG: hypothetical protein U1E06_01270 [Tabrizicola sp.]|uniref:hypothetical protein n=1 Tax=Tabrizicola sp. TaxID=2005166 RepID=UPI00273565FA|nr:hypothetical protein [Tabrizicola sp.]MDP3263241.1 hypothetical protein [Tabrizicola sp.]MDP3646598.1 hypothetical protein [Paracoccaceae bacterium]MDZ4065476.1 hypothetical protein [Tabrizicola sp.]
MTKPPAKAIPAQEPGAFEAGMAAEAIGLDILLAEMRALAALIPGHEIAPRSDSEIEADFDNMPV